MKLLKNARIIILIIFLLFSIIAIYPKFWNEGIVIRSVDKNSPAFFSGIKVPKTDASPMTLEKLVSINNIPINTLADYYDTIKALKANVTVPLITENGIYRLTPQYQTVEKETNETEIINQTVFNETTGENQTVSIEIPKTKTVILYNKSLDIGLNVMEAPKSNLRKGIDLQGGTRILLEPAKQVSDSTMELIIASMEQRLNVFGISDVSIRPVKDLSGKKFISVEIAGATESEVKSLVSQQGKFEAKIGDKTVFTGGNDITYVCRTATCSGIDPRGGCSQTNSGYGCQFQFAISLSTDAAKRQASITNELTVISDGNGQYLSKKLDLFLDDKLMDSLSINAGLKGRAETSIAITGGGQGKTRQEAQKNALSNMKELQTILVTGSLPVKVNIVKTDSISPTLGKEFSKSLIIMFIVAILAVVGVIYAKYRVWKITIPIILTMISEVIIILGTAALIRWNIDIAAIAGIIVAVGTGVDDQIVITDEALRGENVSYNWKEKFKRAFFIIMAAYVTTVVSMLPLLFAGAGLVKGFALTTIIGVSIGVFITRPSYSVIIREVLKKS